MKFPRTCVACNATIKTHPKDELVVGMLVYCSANCRNVHLPSAYRRIRSLVLQAMTVRRVPEVVRVLLRKVLETEVQRG